MNAPNGCCFASADRQPTRWSLQGRRHWEPVELICWRRNSLPNITTTVAHAKRSQRHGTRLSPGMSLPGAGGVVPAPKSRIQGNPPSEQQHSNASTPLRYEYAHEHVAPQQQRSYPPTQQQHAVPQLGVHTLCPELELPRNKRAVKLFCCCSCGCGWVPCTACAGDPPVNGHCSQALDS